MQQEEGAKPQFTLLPGTATQADPQDYTAQLVAIITKLSAQQARGEKIKPYEVIDLLDPTENNASLKDWLAINGVMTRPAFEKAMAKRQRDQKISAALGFVPTDALDYVARYTQINGITLSPKGIVKRNRPYRVGDDVIDESNADQSDLIRRTFQLANADGNDLAALSRELRLTGEKLHLGYRDSVIGDAIASWQEETTRHAKVDAFTTIGYERGRATGPLGQKMWQDMEAACFDVSASCSGFAVAVIRKFMWQVKRKAHGLPVTNHLMPVITGAQGKGKTQFVERMTAPLDDFKSSTDFGVITDNKTIDIWSSYILFLDEMGLLSKADVDQVKNLITRESAPIRLMKQNSSAQVRNCATFIGCSNKNLGQLVRDETGVRRFAELEFTREPDFAAINAIDWTMLWQSIDERADDPMIVTGMMDMLRSQQEDNRNQSPVEVWVRQFGHVHKNWTPARDLHDAYREWEKGAFPRDSTNQNMFGRTLTSLCTTQPDFPLEKQKARGAMQYRWRPNA